MFLCFYLYRIILNIIFIYISNHMRHCYEFYLSHHTHFGRVQRRRDTYCTSENILHLRMPDFPLTPADVFTGHEILGGQFWAPEKYHALSSGLRGCWGETHCHSNCLTVDCHDSLTAFRFPCPSFLEARLVVLVYISLGSSYSVFPSCLSLCLSFVNIRSSSDITTPSYFSSPVYFFFPMIK